MSEWSVAEPRKLTFDAPVTALHVRLVNGMVHVVGTDEDTARLEVSEIEGPPLTVTQKDGVLSVAYDDLPWKGFRKLKGSPRRGGGTGRWCPSRCPRGPASKWARSARAPWSPASRAPWRSGASPVT